MPRYRAVFFDLFDTVVRFDPARLPLVRVGDRTHPSTADLLHDEVARTRPQVSRDVFAAALKGLLATLRERKEGDHREISSDERFGRLLAALGIEEAGLAARLTDVHMAALSRAVDLPREHRELLVGLRPAFKTALVSNFDCARHGRALLRHHGLEDLFDAVVISDEIGWRKPHASLFLGPAADLGVEPGEVLFVGDTPESDVLGAAAVGMDAAWLNREGKPWPFGHVRPAFEIRALAEVRALVGGKL